MMIQLRCIFLEPVKSLHATPHRRDIVLHWNHTDVGNGSYEIDCFVDSDYDNETITQSVSSVVGWIEEFKVEPVLPFTNYTCSIIPITSNGRGNPTETQVEVLQDSEPTACCVI